MATTTQQSAKSLRRLLSLKSSEPNLAAISYGVIDSTSKEAAVYAKSGLIQQKFPVSRKVTVGTMTNTATISVANILQGTIKCTPTAAASYTMPTGAVLAAGLPSTFTTGDSLDFCLVNVATNAAYDITLVTAASGTTLYGCLQVSSNAAVTDISSGIFRLVCTAAATYDIYRIS